MARTWTDDQKNAIEAVRGSVFVSAAAGSGKTAVLSERAIKRITDENDETSADSLLVVTYTNAAAAEMKNRIEEKLQRCIEENPENDEYRRQWILLQNADISTMHSFCLKLAKENFAVLGISPDFRIADESQLAVLKAQALRTTLDKMYEEKEAFSNLIEAFEMSKDEHAVENVVLTLHNFLSSSPFPEEWIKRTLQLYKPVQSAEETYWGKKTIEHARKLCMSAYDIAMKNYEDTQTNPEIGGQVPALAMQDFEYINNLMYVIEDGKWEEIRTAVYLFEAGRFLKSSKFKDVILWEEIKARREKLKNIVTKLKNDFKDSEEEIKRDIELIRPVAKQLFDITKEFSNEYKSLKLNRSLAEFNDLEHWVLKLLVRHTHSGIEFTSLANSISSQYTEVMVDEYQDANQIQELIYRAISDDGQKLFTVGDVKQCIYKFRKAHPEIFLRRRDTYKLYNRQEDNYPGKIILKKNFRSREGILDAVNFVFKNILSKETGQMDYLPEDYLQYGANYEEDNTPDVTYTLFDKKTLSIPSEEAEAKYIGKQIKKMMKEFKVTDNGKLRPACYGDFAILMSSVKSKGNTFISVLEEMDIPAVVSKTEEEFLKSREVDTIVSLLRVIDNPLSDLPLVTVLFSPIYGFTPDDLAFIKAGKRKESLYLALKAASDNGMKKAEMFLSDIQQYRMLATTLPTDTLIRNIYVKTGYMAMVKAMDKPEKCVSNLKLLQEYAKSFEQSSGSGVSSFVSYVDSLVMQGRDLAANPNVSADSDVVNIMTIHGSKGLEFPVCFLAGLGSKINKTTSTDSIIMDEQAGIGVIRKDRQTRLKFQTMPYYSILQEKQREEVAEKLRVIYVAMTRAKEKLFMLSTNNWSLQTELNQALSIITDDGKIDPMGVVDAFSVSVWLTACSLLNPGGEEIRQLVGSDKLISQTNAMPWNVKAATEADIEIESDEEVQAREEINIGTIDVAKIESQINASYKHEVDTKLPRKVSVSEIVHNEDYMSFAAVSRPGFLNEGEIVGAEKGTAVHDFMQYADFEKALLDFSGELDRLVKEQFLAPSQAKAVDREKVKKCIQSPIMKRFCSSEKKYREYRFTIKIPADTKMLSELMPLEDLSENSNFEIILQGAVDCAFEENGEIVIIDYKTDKIKNMTRLKTLYENQLFYYKRALEEVLEKPVKECYIYSFFLDDYILL